jgi:hypothetical protein
MYYSYPRGYNILMLNDLMPALRVVPVGNVLDECFRVLTSATMVSDFTRGNKKLGLSSYVFPSSSLAPQPRFNGTTSGISISEAYDLGFVGLYERELWHRRGENVEVGIALDIQGDFAKDDDLREAYLCDGGILIEHSLGEEYMPVQNRKLIAFNISHGDMEQQLVNAVHEKLEKRRRYPERCALVISIISDNSGADIPYQSALTQFKGRFSFEWLYIVEHHNSLNSATVIEIDVNTMEPARSPMSINPTLVKV